MFDKKLLNLESSCSMDLKFPGLLMRVGMLNICGKFWSKKSKYIVSYNVSRNKLLHLAAYSCRLRANIVQHQTHTGVGIQRLSHLMLKLLMMTKKFQIFFIIQEDFQDMVVSHKAWKSWHMLLDSNALIGKCK